MGGSGGPKMGGGGGEGGGREEGAEEAKIGEKEWCEVVLARRNVLWTDGRKEKGEEEVEAGKRLEEHKDGVKYILNNQVWSEIESVKRWREGG